VPGEGRTRDIASLLRHAGRALDGGHDQAALNLLLKVLEQEPDHIDALLLSAVADTRLKRYEQAIRALDRGLVLYNGDEPSTFLHLLQTTGEVEALPHDEKPLCLAALFHRYLRIFDSAHAGTSIRYAEQAVTANDHADVAYFTIGIVHFREREFDDALPMFQKAIEVNPKHGFAYRWASAIYSDRGELSNEYHMLQKAYEVNPEISNGRFMCSSPKKLVTTSRP